MRTGLALVVAVGVSTSSSSAGSYRWIAPDGTVSYSDQPPPRSATVPASPVAPPVEPSAGTPPLLVAPLRALEPERPTFGPPATVEEILELSGVTRQLGALSATLIAEFKAPASFSPKERAAIERVTASHFQSDRLLATITSELRRRHDQPALDAAAGWLRSPLGRKMTALEIAASRAPEAERRANGPAPTAGRKALIATEPGRRYSTAMSRALTQAISVAAADAARAMIGVVPAERWRDLAMAPPPPR
jgi:hypothetical protein